MSMGAKDAGGLHDNGYRLPTNLCESLLNALKAAALQFDEDERTTRTAARGNGQEGLHRLADQFKRQAEEARKLYDLFSRHDAYPIVVKYMLPETKPEPTEDF